MDKCKELLESQNEENEEKSSLYQSLTINNYFETNYLNLGNKIAKKNIEKIFRLNNGKFVFIFNYGFKKGYEIISKQLIGILNEDLLPLDDNKIDGKIQYISEIKEEEYYLIFCQINDFYILQKDYDYIKVNIGIYIYFILQIKTNKYIISNENGINYYEGLILKITKEKLKLIKIQKIEKEKEKVKEIYNFGIKINQDTIALLNNNNELMIVDINNNKERMNIPNNKFSNFENCYALFRSKENTDILLLGCKHSDKNGILIIIVKNEIYWDFLETNDFEIHCFSPIYEEKIIKAFSESYENNYIYFLLGGNQSTKKIIKLYKINLDDKTLQDVKNICGKNNNNPYYPNKLKSIIIQYKYENSIIIFENGKTVNFNFNNFNLKNEKEIMKTKENEDFYEEINEFWDKMNEQDTIELVKIWYKKHKNPKNNYNKYYGQNLVKSLYQIKNKNNLYLFIVLKNRIFVYNNFEIIDEFYISHEIRCFCQKSESEVFICSSNGLYKITIIINENRARLDKLNDLKYNFIERIKDNDYIVSIELNQKPYRKLRDIQSINEEEFIIRIKDEYYIFSIEKNKNTYRELRDIQSIDEEKFIIRIKDTDYIFSIKKNKKTYRELSDLLSINKEDSFNPNNENKIKKISDHAYKTGVLMEMNNKIKVILMDNIDNIDNIDNNVSNIINNDKEGKLEIIDIDNINDNYTPKKNKNPYNLLKSSIVLYKNPKNYIILTATLKMKENQKNGIFAMIVKALNKPVLEYFHDMKNYKINSMTLYERQNISNEKCFIYILTEGNNDDNELEIRLSKIIYSNDKGEVCFSFEYIQKIIEYKDIKNYNIILAQSIINGHFIISFSIGFYLYKINTELIKKKEEEKAKREEKEEDSIIIRFND